MNRMAYNDQYIIGQRGDEFILYKFGDESMRLQYWIWNATRLKWIRQNLQLKSEMLINRKLLHKKYILVILSLE